MRRISLALILGIILIVLFVVTAFLFLILAKPKYIKQDIPNPMLTVSNKSEVVVGEQHINYILNEIGAYNLHNQPMSSENPLIEVKVDDAIFFSEIIRGEIVTRKEKTYEPDLRIATTNREIINVINSANINDYMKESVSTGNTNIELISGYSELFFKGYVSLYKELTGKTLSGSVIRIFAQS